MGQSVYLCINQYGKRIHTFHIYIYIVGEPIFIQPDSSGNPARGEYENTR